VAVSRDETGMIRYTDIQCALNVLHEAKTEINEKKKRKRK